MNRILATIYNHPAPFHPPPTEKIVQLPTEERKKMTRLDPTDDNIGFVAKSTQQGDQGYTHLQAVPTLFLNQDTTPLKGVCPEIFELSFFFMNQCPPGP